MRHGTACSLGSFCLQKLYINIVVELMHHEFIQSIPGKSTGLVETSHAFIYLVEMALRKSLDVPDVKGS